MPSLPLAAVQRLRAVLGRPDPDVRLIVRIGFLLLASGLFHVLVWLVDGSAWAGPVSWRKPIVFGLSAGVTSLSVAWVVGLLPASRARSRWARVYAAALLAEVFLITLQRWRGVASHFNVATPLDSVIFQAMGLLILCVSVSLAVFTWQLARAPHVAQDDRAAGLLGLGLLHLASLVGVAMVAHGQSVLFAGNGTPGVVAGAGLLKLPHGIALHAVQTLPLLGWLLARGDLSMHERTRWIVRAGVGHTLLVSAVLVQALLGRAPLDPPPVTLVLAGGGLALLLASGVRALLSRAARRPFLRAHRRCVSRPAPIAQAPDLRARASLARAVLRRARMTARRRRALRRLLQTISATALAGLFAAVALVLLVAAVNPRLLLALAYLREPALYTVPVAGVRAADLRSTWGAPRSGGRTHKGVDIFAPRGTPVVSAVDGVVVRVGTNSLGGKVVWVVGDGASLTYYAHLDDWAPGLVAGRTVQAGEVLGYVGNTGNAKTTPSHLHFGFHRLRPGGFLGVDPVPVLQNARTLSRAPFMGPPRPGA